MNTSELTTLRNIISVKAKNGIDFTIAAAIIWAAVAVIWQLDYSAYDKSVFVFVCASPLFPLALLLSRILKTEWTIKDNPIQALGILFNVAQLFYFPFLFFVMIKMPEYFIMTYAIITGAHFFPYSWYYNTRWYGIFAGLISVGSLLLGLLVQPENLFVIGVGMSVSLTILSILLYHDSKTKQKALNSSQL